VAGKSAVAAPIIAVVTATFPTSTKLMQKVQEKLFPD
jgi:hypothetical protein